MAEEIELTDGNFESEILKGKGLAVVDFFSTTCPPCRGFAPVFKQFAAEAPAGVKVGKANVAECEEAAARLGIMMVPTIAFFKDGEAVDRLVGAQSKAALMEKVKALSER